MIFSEKLGDVLRRNGIELMPEYYRTCETAPRNFDDATLERLGRNIRQAFGEEALAGYEAMRKAVPNPDAGRFLLALRALEQAGFEWNPRRHFVQLAFCKNPFGLFWSRKASACTIA